MRHTPVMVDEVLQYLLHERTRVVVDGTVGYGGHAEAILRARPDVFLIGVDRDPAALEAAAVRLSAFRDRLELVQGVYSDLPRILGGRRTVDGFLLDLGVSSPQIDEPARGFSFSTRGTLDMRMARDGETAAAFLARTDVDALAGLLRAFGDVRQPRRVARAIRAASDEGRLATTTDLRDAVIAAVGQGIAPAELARVFQAIRIAVNREDEHLRDFLSRVADTLAPGGRLVVLSYHSLEDRLVKTFMRDTSAGCTCPPALPVCICGRTPAGRLLTRRAVQAGDAEVRANPRARSARLRAIEKIPMTGGGR